MKGAEIVDLCRKLVTDFDMAGRLLEEYEKNPTDELYKTIIFITDDAHKIIQQLEELGLQFER